MITLYPKNPLNLTLNFSTYLFLFSLLFFLSFSGFGQQKAFPTAEGFGKYTTGGRGGIVIKVTNLNDSGPGSLRQAAMYTTVPRTIVFEVGGTITLNSTLEIKGDCTIAGQTAPGDGILIRGSQVTIEESNVIVRYLRFRPGLSVPDNESDGLSITARGSDLVQNIIIDHCSISWAKDENFNIRTSGGENSIVRNITIQNSIISEATYGTLSGGRSYNITYYKNMFAHNQERNIVHNYPLGNQLNFEMINNLIYGCLNGTQIAFGGKFTIINNYYERSSQQILNPNVVDGTSAGQSTPSDTYAYIQDNIVPNGTNQVSSGLEQYLKTSAYNDSGIIALPANQVANNIIPHVGCSLPNRDGVDNRLINQYNLNTGSIATSGLYPFISGGTAPDDSDNDGMPNSWELENGLNPNISEDRNVVQPDGYTNLEYFLNGMTITSAIEINANAGDDVAICKGESITLTATGGNTYSWNTGESNASIVVNPIVTTTYTVTVSNSDGSVSDTDDVTVTVNDLPAINAGQDQTINVGQSVTLTANGANLYSWNTGQSSSNITVSPNTTTTYTVTGISNGCENSDSVTVYVQSVSETVNADIAGGNYSICSGVSTTLVATGGSSYLWNTGQTTSSITVAPTETTTYTVTAFSASGNSQDQDSITISVMDTSLVNAGLDQTIYPNESVTLTASGANSYLWNTGQTTSSITVSPSSTTTYSVTGYINGCNNNDSVTVFVQDEEVDSNITTDNNTICYGTSTILTATGGDTYLWSTGETTSSITVAPNETTTYSVTAYSPSGNNQDQDSIVITVNDAVNANAGNDVEICQGNATTLTANGGSAFIWNTGATTQSITVSPNQQTTYSVEVFNNGCSDTDEVIVKVLPNPIVDAGDDITINQGQSTTLTVTGASSYVWNTGQTASSINVSPSVTTTYTVIGNSNGCEATDDVTVFVQTESVTANAGPDTTICQGETATLVASGGATYQWNTGDTTQSIQVSPSSTTSYTVTAFNSAGTAEDSDTVTVSVNAIPVVDAGNNVTILIGESTTLSASGGNSYIWSTGETSSSITVSPNTTTTYSVTGLSNSCEAEDQVTVFVDSGTGNETVNADIGGGDFSICAGTTTVLVATGGNSYLWSTGETTSIIAISPTETTTYTVTAFSESGNTQDQDSLTVSVYGNVDAGDDVEICLGSSVTLTSTEGESYLWSTGETTQSITVNPSETTTYTVELVERFCTSTDDVTVTVNETLNVNAGNDVTINQGQSVTLTASGADSYLWNTGQTSASIIINPNSTTTYSVTGYSGNCQATDDIIVTVESETVTANAGSDVSICFGDTAVLTASGGVSYLWNTGETTESIYVTPNESKTYHVTAYGTTQDISDQDSVTVTVIPLPIVDAGDNITITQGSDVTLTATGAETYEWSNGDSSSTITVSPDITTTYTVTGYLNGCSASNQVTVFVEEDTTNETVDADIAGGNFSICAGTTTTLVASGGSSYLWSTGETTASIIISPTSTTTYTVIAYSASGNTQDQDSIMVTVFGNANAGEDVEICLGNSTILSASEGNSYLWSTGETTQSITVTPNETTVYSVEVTEKFCTSSDDVVVTVNESLNIDAGNDVTLIEGESTTLVATGAESYLWSTGETTSSITVSPNNTTIYTVTGFSDSCEGSDEITVTVQEDEVIETVIADIAGGDFTICAGATTTLVASGGSSYLWNTGETTPVIMVTPSVTTTYIVTVYSESGNSQDQDSIIIGVNNVEVDAGNDIVIFEGESTTLTASGASSYLWSTGETTQSITVTPSSSSVYSVTGFRKGCQDSDEISVTVESNDIRHERIEMIAFQDSRSRILKIKLVGMTYPTKKEISLLDMNGRTLYQGTMSPSEIEKSIDVSKHKSGIYALSLIYDDQKIVKKIVLE